MKSNYSSITEFAKEIERREQARKDYIVPSTMMRMQGNDQIIFDGMSETFHANPVFHGQVATKLGIPKNYYDKIGEVEGLRAINVNALLRKDDMKEKKHLVRTLDSNARAFLSDRYKTIDNFFFLNTVLPVLMERKDLNVFSNSISDTKMYLQVSFKNMEVEIKQGDPIRWGISLSNSEVGFGAINIEAFIERLICTNGAIGHNILRKMHLGSQITSEDVENGVFKEETIRAEMKALEFKFRDVVAYHLREESFKEYVDQMKSAREMKIENLPKTIQEVTRRFGLTQNDGDIILTNISQEGEVNKYGLANGITYLAQKIDDLDKQYHLEKIGMQIIQLNDTAWRQINVAA